MALIASTRFSYRDAHQHEVQTREKWTWAQSLWFILLSGALFWAGVIALAWKIF
jgi:hypothetical protein